MTAIRRTVSRAVAMKLVPNTHLRTNTAPNTGFLSLRIHGFCTFLTPNSTYEENMQDKFFGICSHLEPPFGSEFMITPARCTCVLRNQDKRKIGKESEPGGGRSFPLFLLVSFSFHRKQREITVNKI